METVWSAPNAEPVATRGLVAERRSIGAALQETIVAPGGAAGSGVKRTDLLYFNRLDGRWDYVSFDTRAPVGLMPAFSTAKGDLDRIEVIFLPFAAPSGSDGGVGQLLRMRQEIIAFGADHDRKDQYFTLADGTGREWLAHRYEYTRRA